MRCYTITESKRIGLRVIVDEDVVGIQVGTKGERHYVPLSQHFQDIKNQMPPGGIDLMLRNPIEWATWNDNDEIGLDKERKGTEALVHLATEPLGGFQLTSSAHKEILDSDGPTSIYDQFPSVGIEVLAIGGDENHMLLKMMKRASFRILRPGAPDGRWHWAKVKWTGYDLLVHPNFRGKKRPKAA